MDFFLSFLPITLFLSCTDSFCTEAVLIILLLRTSNYNLNFKNNQRETTDTDAAESLPKSPLEHLEDVLAEIPNDQSYILKRELLIGVVPDSSATLRATGNPSM